MVGDDVDGLKITLTKEETGIHEDIGKLLQGTTRFFVRGPVGVC